MTPGTMEFDLDSFAINPTLQHNPLRRERGKLMGSSETTAPADPPITPGMSAEELQLTRRIMEKEVRNQELEVEAMHLRVRALEPAQCCSPSTWHTTDPTLTLRKH